MARQQLPPQIKKLTVTDRKTGKPVVRYQLTLDTGKDPQTGRRRQVRRRYNREQDARDALTGLAGQVAAATFVPRKAVTVEQLAVDFLAALHDARPTTINAYRFSLAPLRERHGDQPVQKLTRPDLDKLLVDLRDGGTTTAKGHMRRAWSARSINKSVDAWRALLDYGVERREISHNVAAPMRKVPRVRTEMPTYDAGEIQKVLKAADTDRCGHLWFLALSGLRRGEIAGLKWCDIDLDAKTLRIERARVQAGAGVVIESGPKTLSSRRTLPLDDGLVTVLRRASARQAQERLKLGAAYTDTGYVAVSEAGQPFTPDALSRMWTRITTKKAKVRRIRLHDARHSCGTALHLRGVPMAVIAKWLGHADAATTARIYAHSQDDALKEAAQTLATVVTSGGA